MQLAPLNGVHTIRLKTFDAQFYTQTHINFWTHTITHTIRNTQLGTQL